MRPFDNPFAPGPFGGIDVVVQRDQPGYVLPEDLMLPPAFRAQFNAWAAEFFRPKNLLADDQVIHIKPLNQFRMNPRTYAKFLQATKGC